MGSQAGLQSKYQEREEQAKPKLSRRNEAEIWVRWGKARLEQTLSHYEMFTSNKISTAREEIVEEAITLVKKGTTFLPTAFLGSPASEKAKQTKSASRVRTNSPKQKDEHVYNDIIKEWRAFNDKKAEMRAKYSHKQQQTNA